MKAVPFSRPALAALHRPLPRPGALLPFVSASRANGGLGAATCVDLPRLRGRGL